MDWITIISSAIAAIIGAVGGGGIFYIRETKREKKLDIELKEADAWKCLYEEQRERAEKKSNLIKILYDEIDKHKATEANYLSLIRALKWYRCNENNCANRKPPRDFTKDVESLEADLLEIAKQNKE